MTSGGFESQEIVLADQFAPLVMTGVVNSGSSSANLNVTLDVTLPAALCDETLLKEIQAIPDKMGFKIGEVADMLGIKQYVLRYWETEFEVLKPKKATNNQRFFTRKDVENAFIIRKLLHRDRFSIEGARAALRDVKQFVKKEKNWSSLNSRIDQIQDRIDDLIVDIQKAKSYFL